MASGEILVHTKLFSEDAYQIISAVKKSRYYKLMAYSLDTGKLYWLYRIRSNNNGINYHVLRAPNGEVLVYHSVSPYNNTDSVTTIKRELNDFIKGLQTFTEDEKFIILPQAINETLCATSDYVRRRVNDSCVSVKKFTTQPRNFIYEKIDVDYIFSHPFTVRRLKEVLEKIGKTSFNEDDSELDPFLTEQRKMIYSALVGLYAYIGSKAKIRNDGVSTNALNIMMTRYSDMIEYSGVAAIFTMSASLPNSLMYDLKDRVFKFIENFKGTSINLSSWEMTSLQNEKEDMKAELDEDLFNAQEYKDFISALEMVKDDDPKIPSPSLICSDWRSYAEILKK